MTDIERLLEKVDLKELAERAGATLYRTGKGFRGACPLHGGDNITAFTIYTDDRGRQRWRCYTGCDDGGDAIDFVRRWYHLPGGSEGFIDALQILADFAGVSLDEVGIDPETARRSEERRTRRKRKQELMTLAARYYTHLLDPEAAPDAWAYALGRGWTEETIKTMGLGYSDGRLRAYLEQQDADLEEATETGLLYKRDDGTLVDAIPKGYLVYVHRLYGEVIYLSGRAIFTDEQDKKARNLHAPKRLYLALHKGKRIPLVIVEGQACAISAWESGYNAAALCGTSLDEKTVKLLLSYQPVYVALDPDARDKTHRVADVLGPLVMILPPFPDGKDLNRWHRDGATREDLAILMEQARPWIEVAIEEAAHAPAYELEKHLDHLAQLIVQLPQGTRGRYVREVCDTHKLSLRREFRELLSEYDQAAVDNNGFEIADGCMCYYGDPLCNFVAKVTHELTQDDGLNPPTVLYTVEGALDTGEQLMPVEIKAEDFDSMRWVGRHWGVRPIVYIPPGRNYQLRRAVQEISQADLQRERVFTFTGWNVIEGRRVYMTASGGMGADGLDESVRVDLGANNLGRYELPAPPADLRPAVRASLDLLNLADCRVTIPLWTAMYAAPLSPIKTLNAVMWVYGQTQSGKSTLTHLALAHFGSTFIQGHEYRAPKDWTSTPTDLEGAMFTVKDAPIIIDDYAPAHSGATEARELARKAHYVVRSVGNRSSRGRANADLTERRQRPPRGLVIATAEQPLIGQSIVGRMIYVPVEPGQIIQDRSKGETPLDAAQRQANEGLLAQAMTGYVSWLAGRWDELEKELPDRIQRASRSARGLFPPGQSRLTDYYGLLMTAGQLALEYAGEVGALSQEDVETFTEIFRLHLIDLLKSQSERVASQSPVIKFFEALEDLLAQQKIYFAPRLNVDFVPPYQAELAGWYDDERVYLLTNTALAQVKSYWQALDERFDTLADALRRELWHQGYVAERAPTQYEKKAYINREVGNKRVLVLNPQVVREKAGITLGEEDVP